MPKERTYFVGGFRRKDVFELACLLLDLGLAIQRKAVSEKTFRQAVTANDVRGPLSSARGERNNYAAISDGDTGRLQSVMAGIHKSFVIVRLGRMRRRRDQFHVAHFVYGNAYW